MPDTLLKQKSESRIYSFDYRCLLEEAETLSSVISITAVAEPLSDDPILSLSLGAPVLPEPPLPPGKVAQVRVAGGKNDVVYKLTCLATTSFGNILEGEGYLNVVDL